MISSDPRVFTQVPLVVTTAAGSSSPVSFGLTVSGAALFTANGSGCGPGAIQNVNAAGQISLNSPSNSAQPGDYLVLYGTGFGDSYPSVGDGQAAPSSPPARSQFGGGAGLDGVGALSTFNGKTPGLVGVDQINVQVPDSVREGCAVPLTSGTYGSTTPPVTVAIHRGGGVCVDPAPAAEGTILLKRVITQGSSADGTVDTLDAAFTQSPGRKTSPLNPLGNYASNGAYSFSGPTPQCSIPGYQQLSAGGLTVATSSSTVSSIAPSPSGTYHAVLAPNTFQPGSTAIVSSASSSPVGAFQVSIPVGQDIQILTPPPPVGSVYPQTDSVTLKWTGGDPNSTVTVFLISHFQLDVFSSYCQAPASAGQCSLPTTTLGATTSVTEIHSLQGELLYQIDPNPVSIPFSAPGLSLGGQATWRIQHSFQGFTMF